MKTQTLTHLSIFVLDATHGAPIARMPIYAEVAVTLPEEVPVQGETRLEDALVGGLQRAEPDCADDVACRERLVGALRRAASGMLTREAREELAQAPDRALEFMERVLRRARTASGDVPLGRLEDGTLRSRLEQAMRVEAARQQLGLTPPPSLVKWTHPLGVLASDHVGYLSFDLTRLPAAAHAALLAAIALRKKDRNAVLEAAVLVYPMARDAWRFDALEQGRFAPDAIVIKLEIAIPALPGQLGGLGLLALQNPGLTDWRLSPASFAANPSALVGQQGCENLFPANVAVHEFQFFQVIRLTDPSLALGLPGTLAAPVKLGAVHDYRLSWFPLGHSLGQVIYSLPLAPGESVNLAVIDWTRRDEAARVEDSKLDEQLVHNQRRERTITETVESALREYQRGSSFMGGGAVAAGGSIGVLSAGLTGSLGGGSSNSSGSRDLTATTVQNLSDNVSQASSAMREFQSTIVVQSVQSEREAIETRTVVNYNHSHTLTVLYYEVLRHFRVVTQLYHRRPAVLVRMPADLFAGANAEKNILKHRTALAGALLKPALADGFDALERIAHRAAVAKVAPPPSSPPPGPGDRGFIYFTFEMTTGGFVLDGSDEDERLDITAALYGGALVVLKNRSRPPVRDVLNPRGSFRESGRRNTFVAMLPEGQPPVKWKDIDAISIGINFYEVDDVAFSAIKVTARDVFGADEVLVDMNYDPGHLILAHDSDSVVLPTRRAPGPPVPAGRPAEEIADDVKKLEMIAHFAEHAAHYTRAVVLNENPVERARQLDAIALPGGTTLLDHVENRPLEVIGDYVAYPCSDPAWAARVRTVLDQGAPPEMPLDERLVTLPTRGIFADAKLGHCNVSEEIDNTRFWDWQQSPIPHFAPQIAPVQPVTPQPQQPNLSPTPFPSSLVNIVNPPNAPDPTGMAAALSAITTPNIFRDMSGRTELASLLENLSNNAVSMAQAGGMARSILAKQAASGGGGGGGPGLTRTATGGTSASGAQVGGGMPPSEQLDRMQVVRSAVRGGELSPEEGQSEVRKIIKGPDEADLLQLTLSPNPASERAFAPPDDKSGRMVLGVATKASLPAGAKLEWQDALGFVEFRLIAGTPLQTEVLARKPGSATISVRAVGSDGRELSTASTRISVPRFAEVWGTAADLDAVFGTFGMAARKGDVIRRAAAIAGRIIAGANLRLVWTVAPMAEALPAQFRPGGMAAPYLARIEVAQGAPGADLVVGSGGSVPDGVYDATATLNLASLVSTTGDVGAAFGALMGRLGAAADASLESFVVEILGRILGSYTARTLCALTLPASTGGPPTFAELTGFDLAPGADAADPASYADRAEAAMALRPSTLQQLAALFPVPPEFS